MTIPQAYALEPDLRQRPERLWGPRIGATLSAADDCRFLLWAPRAENVSLHVFAPREQLVRMERGANGYHFAALEGLGPGALYKFRLNGDDEYPDPASRSQPRGVRGPSEVLADDFIWRDRSWFGVPLHELVLYELHVGTFTPEGTFDAIIPELDELVGLGITGIELMPVAQFPGNRNWGYDGVYPFAVQNSYGGAAGLRRLIDAAHARGLAVILDTVYNHLGPEGNYLARFGPYFTERYLTPWGAAINFDGTMSGEVRRFFLENARSWIADFHLDGLRLDAVHAIHDESPRPILQDLSEAVHSEGERLNRRTYLFAESDRNDVRLVLPSEAGGMGSDAQWNDDFHHALHVLLTRENAGYYQDFDGAGVGDLARAYRDGYVYSGQYSRYRRRAHGTDSRHVAPRRFIVFSQNHDQIGNRGLGERLAQLTSFEELKIAAAAVLLSPFVPLLFMGEEYGETAPFQYFVSHSDPGLIDAVRQGRLREFAAFGRQHEAADPQDESTFSRSSLDRSRRSRPKNAVMLRFYHELLRLRRRLTQLGPLIGGSSTVSVHNDRQTLVVSRSRQEDHALLVFHFGQRRSVVDCVAPSGLWLSLLDSAEARWLGPGSNLAPRLQSNGEFNLDVAPNSVCVLWRAEED